MIKENKKPCWVGLCDNCGECLFGADFVNHFDSKKELLERLEDECDYIIKSGKKYFCSEDCLDAYKKKGV